MKKDISKQILKAITVGLSASMMLQPISVFAAEDDSKPESVPAEPLQVTGNKVAAEETAEQKLAAEIKTENNVLTETVDGEEVVVENADFAEKSAQGVANDATNAAIDVAGKNAIADEVAKLNDDIKADEYAKDEKGNFERNEDGKLVAETAEKNEVVKAAEGTAVDVLLDVAEDDLKEADKQKKEAEKQENLAEQIRNRVLKTEEVEVLDETTGEPVVDEETGENKTEEKRTGFIAEGEKAVVDAEAAKKAAEGANTAISNAMDEVDLENVTSRTDAVAEKNKLNNAVSEQNGNFNQAVEDYKTAKTNFDNAKDLYDHAVIAYNAIQSDLKDAQDAYDAAVSAGSADVEAAAAKLGVLKSDEENLKTALADAKKAYMSAGMGNVAAYEQLLDKHQGDLDWNATQTGSFEVVDGEKVHICFDEYFEKIVEFFYAPQLGEDVTITDSAWHRAPSANYVYTEEAKEAAAKNNVTLSDIHGYDQLNYYEITVTYKKDGKEVTEKKQLNFKRDYSSGQSALVVYETVGHDVLTTADGSVKFEVEDHADLEVGKTDIVNGNVLGKTDKGLVYLEEGESEDLITEVGEPADSDKEGAAPGSYGNNWTDWSEATIDENGASVRTRTRQKTDTVAVWDEVSVADPEVADVRYVYENNEFYKIEKKDVTTTTYTQTKLVTQTETEKTTTQTVNDANTAVDAETSSYETEDAAKNAYATALKGVVDNLAEGQSITVEYIENGETKTQTYTKDTTEKDFTKGFSKTVSTKKTRELESQHDVLDGYKFNGTYLKYDEQKYENEKCGEALLEWNAKAELNHSIHDYDERKWYGQIEKDEGEVCINRDDLSIRHEEDWGVDKYYVTGTVQYTKASYVELDYHEILQELDILNIDGYNRNDFEETAKKYIETLGGIYVRTIRNDFKIGKATVAYAAATQATADDKITDTDLTEGKTLSELTDDEKLELLQGKKTNAKNYKGTFSEITHKENDIEEYYTYGYNALKYILTTVTTTTKDDSATAEVSDKTQTATKTEKLDATKTAMVEVAGQKVVTEQRNDNWFNGTNIVAATGKTKNADGVDVAKATYSGYTGYGNTTYKKVTPNTTDFRDQINAANAIIKEYEDTISEIEKAEAAIVTATNRLNAVNDKINDLKLGNKLQNLAKWEKELDSAEVALKDAVEKKAELDGKLKELNKMIDDKITELTPIYNGGSDDNGQGGNVTPVDNNENNNGGNNENNNGGNNENNNGGSNDNNGGNTPANTNNGVSPVTGGDSSATNGTQNGQGADNANGANNSAAGNADAGNNGSAAGQGAGNNGGANNGGANNQNGGQNINNIDNEPVAQVAQPQITSNIDDSKTAKAAGISGDIADSEVPMATLPEAQKLSWWWLLVVLILGGTGAEMYRRHLLKKSTVKDTEKNK